jgi:hypothetical protein
MKRKKDQALPFIVKMLNSIVWFFRRYQNLKKRFNQNPPLQWQREIKEKVDCPAKCLPDESGLIFQGIWKIHSGRYLDIG